MDPQTFTRAMLNPAAYPNPAQHVDLIETHISQVFLAGDFAYKVRKPVKLDFVDFSTLAARRTDCEEELRLNRRLAPELYLGVVPITQASEAGAVRVGGEGPPIEHAVWMRRFDQQDLLRALVLESRIEPAHIDALATVVADFHAAAPITDPSAGYGSPARIHATLDECAQGILRLTPEPELAQAAVVAMRERASKLDQAFASRLHTGHVRECHGDLHLGNVVLVNNTPTPFDCLEFSPAYRWIDTINDVAFAFMDLLACKRQALAYRLLNGYLERSGDYAGLALLPFYTAMRALIRVRVLLERVHQLGGAAAAGATALSECRELLSLALALTSRDDGKLVLMHGLSGSGKSTIAAQIVEAGGMVRVRSDAERRRPRRTSAASRSRYTKPEVDRTYRRLRAICKLGIGAGFPMIADATFLARRQRERFHDLARRLGVPVVIVDCEAEPAVLRARIVSRAHGGKDASEADLAVLEGQLRTQEPLTDAELEHVVRAVTPAQVTRDLARRFPSRGTAAPTTAAGSGKGPAVET